MTLNVLRGKRRKQVIVTSSTKSTPNELVICIQIQLKPLELVQTNYSSSFPIVQSDSKFVPQAYETHVQKRLEISAIIKGLTNNTALYGYVSNIKASGKDVLQLSGIDTSIFSAHSTRHTATSTAHKFKVDLNTEQKNAGWTDKSKTFPTFCNRHLTNENHFAGRNLILI